MRSEELCRGGDLKDGPAAWAGFQETDEEPKSQGPRRVSIYGMLRAAEQPSGIVCGHLCGCAGTVLERNEVRKTDWGTITSCQMVCKKRGRWCSQWKTMSNF